MPIPSSVDDLDPAATNNSPGGSEPIGSNLDGYLRAHAALIRQVSDASKVEAQIHGATSKATPVDADELPIADSEASFGRKKLTWAKLKAALFGSPTVSGTISIGSPGVSAVTSVQVCPQVAGGSIAQIQNRNGVLALGFGGTPAGATDFLTLAPNGKLTVSGLVSFAVGANIASAATVNLTTATGNTVHITGTTPISAWTMLAGQTMDVIFSGITTLVHAPTTNNLPGAANITTAVGDRARFYHNGTTVYCLSYTRANGTALVAAGPLMSEYVSPEQTITSGGSLTLSAGFAPKFVTAELVCVTSGNSYTAGNVVQIATTQQSTDAHLNCGLNIEKSGSSIFVRFGSNPNVFMMGDKNSGVGTTVPNANWRLVVRAYA